MPHRDFYGASSFDRIVVFVIFIFMLPFPQNVLHETKNILWTQVLRISALNIKTIKTTKFDTHLMGNMQYSEHMQKPQDCFDNFKIVKSGMKNVLIPSDPSFVMSEL